MAPVVDADGKEGRWEPQMRSAVHRAMPFGDHYEGHGTPVSFAELHNYGYVAPQLGDTVVMGVPQPGVPLRFWSPQEVKPDPAQRALLDAQASAVARAQTRMGDVLREHAIHAISTMLRLPMMRVDLRGTA